MKKLLFLCSALNTTLCCYRKLIGVGIYDKFISASHFLRVVKRFIVLVLRTTCITV